MFRTMALATRRRMVEDKRLYRRVYRNVFQLVGRVRHAVRQKGLNRREAKCRGSSALKTRA
jgi:hypothetical protein